MISALALLLVFIFCALASVHVYWACGGRKWQSIAVPERPSRNDASTMERAFQPGNTGTLAVAAVLFMIAGMAGMRGGWFGGAMEYPGLRAGLALVAAAMLLRAIGDFRLVGFFKKIRTTRFARMDTLAYSPLCCALGLGLAALARSS